MIPLIVYALWNSLRSPQRRGTSLMSMTATHACLTRIGAINPGDTVLYSAPRPDLYEQLDGQVIAVSDGPQVLIGEARLDGRNVVVDGRPYPRHMVRGIIWAVLRPVPRDEQPNEDPVANRAEP